MIIVSGKLYVRAGQRDAFLTSSQAAMTQARQTTGCHDFVVAADPLEPNRVNIYEAWESEEALLTFRGEGPSDDLSSLIERVDVHEYVVMDSSAA
ncbi:MAG: antibiotic biosynthesis monooxygenase [Deinococcota bacterium]